MQTWGHDRPQQVAFTLHAVLISSSIFLMVAAGLIAANLFGLQMCQITQAKLSAHDQFRKLLNVLISDVRSAQRLQIGQGTATTFQGIALNRAQQGNAILLYPSSTNTNQFIRYFVDTTDKKLKRMTNGASVPKVIAHAVSNSVVFSAQNFGGTTLTNPESQCVIGVNLQFNQLQFPFIDIGPGKYYDAYQLQTRIARRAME